MSKSTILTSQQYQYIQEIKPFHTEKKKIVALKHMLFEGIKDFYGDRWYTFKKEVQAALQDLCFKSQERGVCYYQPSNLAIKYGIGVRTVRRRLSELVEANLITIAYCRNTKGNSRKKTIYFFTQHPYFSHWQRTFQLELHTQITCDGKNNGNNENDEIPSGSKDELINTDSTYSLPKSINIFNHSMSNRQYFIRYVPKLINQIYASIFGDTLQDYWKRILIACNKAANEYSFVITKDERVRIARESLQSLHRYISYKHNMHEEFPVEEQYKVLYTIVYRKAIELAKSYITDSEEEQENQDIQLTYPKVKENVTHTKPQEEWSNEELELKRLLDQRIMNMQLKKPSTCGA